MTISWPDSSLAALTKSLKRKRELARVQLRDQRSELTHLDNTHEATVYERGHRLGQSNSYSGGER